MKKRGHCVVSGQVQGVCYRARAIDEAERLCLTGWVRNLRDGRVEAVAEGEEKDVAAFLDWCRRGPTAAAVTGVEASYSEATGEFRSFAVRHG